MTAYFKECHFCYRQTRRRYQYCRFQKCLAVGMKTWRVLNEKGRMERKKKAAKRREKKAKKDLIEKNELPLHFRKKWIRRYIYI